MPLSEQNETLRLMLGFVTDQPKGVMALNELMDAARSQGIILGIAQGREEARREVENLVKELADDLEGELHARFDGVLDYPSEARRFERDMASVKRARAYLANQAKKDER